MIYQIIDMWYLKRSSSGVWSLRPIKVSGRLTAFFTLELDIYNAFSSEILTLYPILALGGLCFHFDALQPSVYPSRSKDTICEVSYSSPLVPISQI